MGKRVAVVAASLAVLAACGGGGGHKRVGASVARPGTFVALETTTSTTDTTPTTVTSDAASTSAVPAPAPAPATTAPPKTTTSRRTVTAAPTTTRPATPAPTTAPSPPATGTSVGGCQMFPADNPWNQDVSGLPVDPNSGNYIASIGASGHLHPDFGSDPSYGIPYLVVGPSQPDAPINYTDSGDESDPGPFPIPQNAPVEAGSDAHVLVVDSGNCTLYELFGARPNGQGWDASSGAKWPLGSNQLRHEGWTSADAAGLPILPGLARFDEVKQGAIRHALRFTVQHTQNGHIHPATHDASSNSDPNLPPMGLRLRLKSSFDISAFHGESRVILEALKRYGMIVADNGSNWYISGATDSRWNDDDLDLLKTVPGSAFEAVQTGPIIRG